MEKQKLNESTVPIIDVRGERTLEYVTTTSPHQIQSKRQEDYSSVCDGQHIESDRGSADFKGLVWDLVSPCIFNAYQTQQLRLTGVRISKPPAPLLRKPVIFRAKVIQQLDLFKPIHH
jgi:hypothetical protein